MTSEQSLENLERELSRAKRRTRWLLAVVGVCFAVSLFAWAFGPATVEAQSGGGVPTEVRARRFVLMDDKGKVRAVLGMTKAGAGMSFYDENGQGRITLRMMEQGAELRLWDDKGKREVALNMAGHGPELKLWDEKKNLRAGLGVTENGGVLQFGDENGQLRATLGAGMTGTSGGKVVHYPESTIHLYSADGRIIWSAP